ncbi:MAG TPA: 8-oxo-dGTP diphosphatase [Bacilli bacterium]|nr:8-oxo-dGTP diphosphatase [Bacilli bacterium]
MKKIETTLLLLRKDDQILLALKKRGFGVGKYNGVGGKLEPGETPEEAMIRETEEEIGVTPTKYEKMGENVFEELMNEELVFLRFHLYVATEWLGDPVETEEMKPYWFNIAKIPYDKMFADDRYWLPLVLEGKKISGTFKFDEDWHLISYDIKEIFDKIK